MTAPEDLPADARTAGAVPLFPTFLKLAGRKVVLVGGGKIAAGKLPALLAAGAKVSVVAPEIVPALRVHPGVTLHERPFAPDDLAGAWFVVAAAPPAVNRAVLAAAEPRGLFVNAVDDLPAASAYAGAIVRKGPVTLAISTGGAAPALSGLVREALDHLLPDEIDRWGDVAEATRAAWKRAGVPIDQRRPLLLEALNRLYDRAPESRP